MNPVAPVYDRLASIYDRGWRSFEDSTLRAVLEAIDCQGDERILDVACGTGELERRLLARWPTLHIVAADLSSGMLNQAVEKDKKHHVSWLQADVTWKACSWWLRWTDPAFYRTYALSECRTLLEQTGFQVVQAKRFRISWLWGLMRFVCRRRPEQDGQVSG